MYGRIHDPEVVPHHPRVRRGVDRGCDFHTFLGAIRPGDVHFCPQVVGVLDVGKDF